MYTVRKKKQNTNLATIKHECRENMDGDLVSQATIKV